MSSSKKDLNYIAKIEQAIAEKYGAETVQNPKSGWSPQKEEEYREQVKKLQEKINLLEEKTEKIELSGFLVSKRLLNRDNKRTCPICETYSFKSEDDVYMKKYECCYKCYISHVVDREERWEGGWRPKKSE